MKIAESLSIGNNRFLAHEVNRQPEKLSAFLRPRSRSNNGGHNDTSKYTKNDNIDNIIQKPNFPVHRTQISSDRNSSSKPDSRSGIYSHKNHFYGINKNYHEFQKNQLDQNLSFSEKPQSQFASPCSSYVNVENERTKERPSCKGLFQYPNNWKGAQVCFQQKNDGSVSSMPDQRKVTSVQKIPTKTEKLQLESERFSTILPGPKMTEDETASFLVKSSLPMEITSSPCLNNNNFYNPNPKKTSAHHVLNITSYKNVDHKENIETQISMNDMKSQEVLSRLKYISRLQTSNPEVIIKILNDVILNDSQAILFLCGMGRKVGEVLSQLQTSNSKAEKIISQLGRETENYHQIICAIIESLKAITKDLFQVLKSTDVIHSKAVNKETGRFDLLDKKGLIGAERQSTGILSNPTSQSTDKDTKQSKDHNVKRQPFKEVIENKQEKFKLSEPEAYPKTPSRPLKETSEEENKKFGFVNDDRMESDIKLITEQKFSFKVCSTCKVRKQIALGFEDGSLSFISLATGSSSAVNLDRCVRLGTNSITQICFLEDNSFRSSFSGILLISIGLRDPNLIFFSLSTDAVLREVSSHSQFVTGLVPISDGFAASSSFDKTIKVWDCTKQECIVTQYIHDAPILSCVYSSELDLLASGDLLGNITLLTVKISSGKVAECGLYCRFKANGPVLGLCFDPFKRIVSFENSKMKVYDCRGTTFKEIKNHFYLASVVFLNSNEMLVVDITGRPTIIDYEQALCDNSLPKPVKNYMSDEIELASKAISRRVTGVLPGGVSVQFQDRILVFATSLESNSLVIHSIPLQYA